MVIGDHPDGLPPVLPLPWKLLNRTVGDSASALMHNPETPILRSHSNMGTALTIDIKELRDGIAERLNLMLEYARKGDRLLVGMLGKTVEAELRRLITPVRGNTEQPQDRPVAAVQMGLSVDHLKEIRTLIFQAGTAFTGGNRDAAVALIHRALTEWQRM